MRIVFLTDTHLVPSLTTRNDDYAATILAKWRYVCRKATEWGADLIVHGGDVFDKPTVPRWLEHSVLALIDESPVRHCIVCGTHDIGSGEPTTFGRSIGVLASQRNVYAFSGPGSVRVGDLLLCGACADVDWQGGAEVIAVHQMLTDVEVPWEHQNIREIQTNAKFVLSGDYHPGWCGNESTCFINPGALGRTFRSPHDMTRQVMAAAIDTESEHTEQWMVPHEPAQNIYVEKDVPAMAELRASVADAIEDAKQKLGPTGDVLDVEGLELETPAPIQEGLARLKELCKEVETTSE